MSHVQALITAPLSCPGECAQLGRSSPEAPSLEQGPESKSLWLCDLCDLVAALPPECERSHRQPTNGGMTAFQ